MNIIAILYAFATMRVELQIFKEYCRIFEYFLKNWKVEILQILYDYEYFTEVCLL